MAKRKYYVVWKGRETGVFDNWDRCKASVDKFEGAQYKSFDSEAQAQAALQTNYWQCIKNNNTSPAVTLHKENTAIVLPAICVDAACSGNPGDMEYRGVDLESGKEIFRSKVYKEGTNNIGEFLAIVHGLSLLKQKGLQHSIYSDSKTAIGWINKKKCNTKLLKTAANAELHEIIIRAERWLANNSYTTKIYKWETEEWGEIPADFGRK